jgi:hypothetical protein
MDHSVQSGEVLFESVLFQTGCFASMQFLQVQFCTSLLQFAHKGAGHRRILQQGQNCNTVHTCENMDKLADKMDLFEVVYQCWRRGQWRILNPARLLQG